MKSSWMKFATLGALPFLGACAQDTGPAVPPNAVSVNVAPLTLPGIGGASYDLTVTNGQGQTVWTKTNVTAGQYGDGKGSIAYVGPCDADTTPAGNEDNTVSLTLNNLYGLDGVTPLTAADYTNPCPAATPCTLTFACQENADVPVTFNLTIMRSANQGFFDIAVNFDNIFCSAKFDTCYPDENGVLNDPIELLFAADGERHHTGVLGFACTAGPNATDATHLYMTDLHITCPDGQGGTDTFTLSPSAGPGNALSPALAVNDATVTSGTAVWQYAVYEGQEQLNCGVDAQGAPISCDKMYWNVAIGLEGLPAGCNLIAGATASDGPLPGGFILPGSSYPGISFGTQTAPIPLTDASGVICQANPLNGPGSGVITQYTDPADTTHIDNEATQDGSGGVTTDPTPDFIKFSKGTPGATLEAPGQAILFFDPTSGNNRYLHCNALGVTAAIYGPITDLNQPPQNPAATNPCDGTGFFIPNDNSWYSVVLTGGPATATFTVNTTP